MLNTVSIGDIGESVGIAEFVKAGFAVSKPLTNNARYDLIVDIKNKLYKVQVKSTQSIVDGKMLFVKVLKGEEMVNVDSAEVVHGMFAMKGQIDSSVIASLYMDEQSIMPFVVERGKSSFIG